MKPRDLFLLLLLASLWGLSYLLLRVAGPVVGALPLAFLRAAIGAGLLAALMLVRRDPVALAGRWRHVFGIALINNAIPFFCLTYATSHLQVGYAAILNATSPLFGAVIAAVWLRQRIGGGAAVGLGLGFLGVALLLSEKLAHAPTGTVGLAILASLFGAANYGFGASYTRRYLAGAPAMALTFGSLAIASAVLAVPAALTWPSAPIPAWAWACAAALGIATTGLAYIIYYVLIERIGPARAITVTYLVPVFGTSFAAIFLHEAVTPVMLLGGAVVLLGVALATGVLPRRKAVVLAADQ
jgi:drug/metabolite transporter (DMT)-like permease